MDYKKIFARNIASWGEEKQKVLAESTILVAGIGGLGCVVSELLVRSGIGRLITIDRKEIDEPDLNRQALYTLDDLGKSKTDVSTERLRAINGFTEIAPINITIDEVDFSRKMARYRFDGIADCLDNYPGRFALETILKPGEFLVHGGILNDYGQITTVARGKTPLLRDIYGGLTDACDVIPVSPQIVFCVSSIMANEILKNLWGEPQLMSKLLVVELSDYSMTQIDLAMN
ncbi:MAG: HesA/MoeB/ThiF family protein [Desulfobacterales bacterium]|nr:HesA/MoeB/ThiF family protein [Desulfobacterales bacterium]MDD4073242.1 HesA/MoeB/ThiF family protein [Desulfobacterales bacterium]MDD4394037.1 HesA/MoeB/ThiF family protein [Desulfobacterales bacterium]